MAIAFKFSLRDYAAATFRLVLGPAVGPADFAVDTAALSPAEVDRIIAGAPLDFPGPIATAQHDNRRPHRQGDLLFLPIILTQNQHDDRHPVYYGVANFNGHQEKVRLISLLPLARQDGRLILALGETSGHAHVIEAEDAELYETANAADRWLRLQTPAPALQIKLFEIADQEALHGPVELEAGDWLVRRPREYQYGRETIRID